MDTRVVITGLGVCSPIAIGVDNFYKAIRKGVSGIKYYELLKTLNHRCQIGAMPEISETEKADFIKKYNLVKLKGSGIIYGCMAGIEAWKNAGLEFTPGKNKQADWSSACIFGTCTNGIDAIDYGIDLIDTGDVRKMGGRTAQQAMNSGVSAYLGGIIGIGNQLTTNSSSCITGAESVLEGYYRIRSNKAKIALVGSSESSHHNIWGAYDSMLLYGDFSALAKGYNNTPEKASCPMSMNANGLVPGAAGAALVLESLQSAKKRGAKIYAEVLGGSIISGGETKGATTTLNGRDNIENVIKFALDNTNLQSDDIDLISGHLPSYILDVMEVEAWSKVLNKTGKDFPYINALKSMTGHCFGASSSLEIVASALQLHHGFIHASLNAQPLHPEIEKYVHKSKIPQKAIKKDIQIIGKTSFGFSNLASCIFLKKWQTN